MATLTLSEAARACNGARTTMQRAIKTGRLSLDAAHRVDTAELLRVSYQLAAAVLPAAAQQVRSRTQQPMNSRLLRQEREALQRERDLRMQQVTLLHTMHQTTQQQLTQARQMLHEMPHRSDRLLEAPRSAPAPPGPMPTSETSMPRGEMRRRIVALLQEYLEGLSPAQTRHLLGIDKDLGSTMKAMARDGLIRRVETGRYVAAETLRNP